MDRARAVGLDVNLTCTGSPAPLSGGLHLAAYRVVQEGLTNVAKHAPGGRAAVSVVWRPGLLEVVVRSTSDPAVPSVDRTVGHGLVGLGERVALYDGSLVAEPTGEGGFTLAARLPLS